VWVNIDTIWWDLECDFEELFVTIERAWYLQPSDGDLSSVLKLNVVVSDKTCQDHTSQLFSLFYDFEQWILIINLYLNIWSKKKNVKYCDIIHC